LKDHKQLKSSKDVWYCAFLMKKGYKIQSYNVFDRGKVCCYFDISDEDWKKLKLEFNHSELSEYKMLIDKIKDLCF